MRTFLRPDDGATRYTGTGAMKRWHQMSDYKRILAVVDLTEDSDTIIRRANQVAHRLDAELALLHVVEYVPVEPMGEALMPAIDIEKDLVRSARERLDALSRSHHLGEALGRVEVGSIKGEVMRVVEEDAIDLVVVGSHERHGLALLRHGTEDAVLHGAPCDVLAVRLDD